jgi:lysozyme family protein
MRFLRLTCQVCLISLLASVYSPAYAADVRKSLVVVFGHEGGLQCDADDPGNWTGGKVGVCAPGTLGPCVHGCTKYGIAPNSYPREDIRNMSLKRAGVLYTRDYWNRLYLSQLESQGIATEIFDNAVNMGAGASGNIVLQTINHLAPAHYKLNGRVNPEMIEWINKYTRRKVNRVKFWKILNVFQAVRYMSIVDHSPGMRQYENSWFSRVGD